MKRNKMRIKAVLFDFDGTLVDTPPLYDYDTRLLGPISILVDLSLVEVVLLGLVS